MLQFIFSYHHYGILNKYKWGFIGPNVSNAVPEIALQFLKGPLRKILFLLIFFKYSLGVLELTLLLETVKFPTASVIFC